MLTSLNRNWWLFFTRGVISIIIGVLALIWPEQAKLALTLLFGAFIMLDGGFSLIAGIASYRYFDHWWAMSLEGVAGIAMGLLTFFWPNITALVLVFIIAAWAFITGCFEIVAAMQLRHVISGELAMTISGLLSILFSVLLFVFPAAGAVSLVWLIGIYAIVFGILLMILAFHLRDLRRDFEIIHVSGL